MELADGTPAAFGVRVVTVRGSGSSHCKIGHTSVICKINPDRDPVVRWDHNGEERRANPQMMPAAWE